MRSVRIGCSHGKVFFSKVIVEDMRTRESSENGI